jgi:hypothetical protein
MVLLAVQEVEVVLVVVAVLVQLDKVMLGGQHQVPMLVQAVAVQEQ